MRGRFCIECGKKADVYIEGLCPECYRNRNPLLQISKNYRKEIRLCKYCGALYYKGKWLYPKTQDYLREAIEITVKDVLKVFGRGKIVNYYVNLSGHDNLGNTNLKITVYGTVSSKINDYYETYFLTCRIKYVTCPSCIDLLSKHEVSNIQIRTKSKNLSNELRSEIKHLIFKNITPQQQHHIVEWKETNTSIDIKLSSKATAKKIASLLSRKYDADVKITSKSIGQKNGKPKTRETYRILIHGISPNDIITVGNYVYKVLKVDHKTFLLLSLKTHEPKIIEYRKGAPKIKVIKNPDLREAMIISLSPPNIQLMYLDNYEIFEIQNKVLSFKLKEGQIVSVLKYNEEMYLIPRMSKSIRGE